MSEWTSVKERLPSGRAVLVWDGLSVKILQFWNDDWWYPLSDQKCRDAGVTHWMPLPDPPKEIK